MRLVSSRVNWSDLIDLYSSCVSETSPREADHCGDSSLPDATVSLMRFMHVGFSGVFSARCCPLEGSTRLITKNEVKALHRQRLREKAGQGETIHEV